MLSPITRVTAAAAPLDIAKIDTGMIVPVRFQRLRRRAGEPDNARVFLHDLRFDESGQPRHEFVLNHPAYREAAILVAGADFGCGSSRESAAYAVLDYGIRVLIAESFGDVFAANCMQNGVLPVVLPPIVVHALWRQLRAAPGVSMQVDLEAQTVTAPDGTQYRFDIDATRKERLLKGLDDVGVTLQHMHEIETFERRRRAAMTWLPSIR